MVFFMSSNTFFKKWFLTPKKWFLTPKKWFLTPKKWFLVFWRPHQVAIFSMPKILKILKILKTSKKFLQKSCG